jgi:Wax ester synthase-like Acyl-CoA acyltransferase domain
MSRSERMSSIDTTWLRMDRPANPMMIVAVWILEGPVALDKVEKQIAEGNMSYRRYRQKVGYAPDGVHWRDDPNFDLAHHIKRTKLPGRGGKEELERSSATSPPSRSILIIRSGRCISSRSTRAARPWCFAFITRWPTGWR